MNDIVKMLKQAAKECEGDTPDRMMFTKAAKEIEELSTMVEDATSKPRLCDRCKLVYWVKDSRLDNE